MEPNINDTITRLAAAAEALERATERLQTDNQELSARLERVVAAIDEDATLRRQLEDRIAILERENGDLKAQAATARRKTLSPLATALLSKSGVESGAAIDPAVLDKALAALSVEQRIAVKAEMARAGIIE